MIKGFDKLIKQEFNFPIMNADNAMYRIDSVNEVKDEGNTKWYGVLGCKYIPNPQLNYVGIPDYVVFTVDVENGKYKISGMVTNLGTQTIHTHTSEIDTMANFILTLRRIAVLFDKANKN